MTAAELYKAGQLQNAIEAQVLEVKQNPTDHAKRLFLFELLTFAGDLDRARRQIDMIEYKDTHLDAATAIYKRLLESEQAGATCFPKAWRQGSSASHRSNCGCGSTRSITCVTDTRKKPPGHSPVPTRRSRPYPAGSSTGSRSSRCATPTTCSPGCWKSWPMAVISGSGWSRFDF